MQYCPSEDAYNVLGISESAPPSEIKKAYKTLALRLHPDKCAPEARSRHEDLFKAVGGAYENLRDPHRRRKYDEERALSKCSWSFSKTSGVHDEYPDVASEPSSPVDRPGSSASQRSYFRQRAAERSASMASTRTAMDPEPESASSWRWAQPAAKMGATATQRSSSLPFTHAARRTQPKSVWQQRPSTAPEGLGSALAACAMQQPPSMRVPFSAASAAVGPARGGQQEEEFAEARCAQLRAVAHWVIASPSSLLEVRGCVYKGEVPESQQERLGLARGQSTLEFLTTVCLVPAERCRVSARIGEEYQGTEIRAMSRLAIDGSFKGDSLELQDQDAAVNEVVAKMKAVRGQRAALESKTKLYIEVKYSASQRLAERRLAALLQPLLPRGIARRRFRGQVRAGLVDEAAFYAYDELPPPAKAAVVPPCSSSLRSSRSRCFSKS
eukprot:TRINITY_DN32655_c0_g1_i2.p1 TRINITY_DN32655_c0_g1~~TRINITY_DN32655_c0_g1_i2.p1  ORF type:complete len:441 (+),score=78.10 TRINITY_DN32655_c0_g1_i2:98-1420(+)